MKILAVFSFLSFFCFNLVSQENILWGNCLNGDVWIVFDISGSMADQEDTINNSVKLISGRIIESNPNARVGLWSFNDSAKIESELGHHFLPNIESISASGGTNIGSALESVYFHDKNSYGDRSQKKIIILISDGEQNQLEGDKRYSTQTILADASKKKEEGFIFISIHLDSGTSNSGDFMKKLGTNLDGSQLYYKSSLENLPLFFQQFSCM